MIVYYGEVRGDSLMCDFSLGQFLLAFCMFQSITACYCMFQNSITACSMVSLHVSLHVTACSRTVLLHVPQYHCMFHGITA